MRKIQRPNNDPKLIIFDLGGVLIRNQGCNKITSWSKKEISVSEFNELWLRSKNVREFEMGLITDEAFITGLIHEFHLAITANELKNEFSNFLIGYFEGTEAFLQKLSKRYTLATLTNTNSIHWNRIINGFNLSKYIHNNFPSHLTGLVKPDRNAYENLLKQMDIMPDSALFFDDNIHNVNTAKEVGLQSYQVNGIEEVIGIMESNYA